MNCSTPCLPLLNFLPEFPQAHVHWVSDAIQPSHPLSPTSPPTLNLSQHQGLFQWISSSRQLAKAWEFQHQSIQEYSGSISYRIDWFESLSSKGLSRDFSSITVQKHQFFSAQPSLWSKMHIPYMTTGKTIVFTRWTFVGKVMSLLFNMLSRLVIGFFPRSKHLLISWLQSPSAVILEPQN